MTKHIFTYSLYAESEKNKGKMFPCGGAFCAKGARNVIEEQKKNGFNVVAVEITMYDYSNGCLNYNNPLSQRIVNIKAN